MEEVVKTLQQQLNKQQQLNNQQQLQLTQQQQQINEILVKCEKLERRCMQLNNNCEENKLNVQNQIDNMTKKWAQWMGKINVSKIFSHWD